MSEEKVTWDHRFFYIEGEKFFPLIQEEVAGPNNTVLIKIPYLAEEIESFKEKAVLAISLGKWVLWELDFGWEVKPLFIQDSSLFFSYGLWIEEFTQKLWTPFKEHTLGVVLFRGVADFSSYFIWTEQQEEMYQEKLFEYPLLKKEQVRFLFSIDVLSEYLQRLCSFLPDSVAAVCLVDAKEVLEPSFASYCFSKDRFGHLLLGLKDSPIGLGHLIWEKEQMITTPSQDGIGFCLPPLEKVSLQDLSLLESTLQNLIRNCSFRVIAEGGLHEGWDGIDDLVVISSLLTPQGKRKIQGFLAAGGRIVSVGENLHTENEIGIDKFF